MKIGRKEFFKKADTAQKLFDMVCKPCRKCLCDECKANLEAHDRKMQELGERIAAGGN